MLLSRDKSKGQYEIKSYEPGKIIVNDQTYTKSLIITAERLIPDWKPQCFSEVNINDFEIIFSLHPEIIILGTGETMQLPTTSILQKIASQRIGFEAMNNSAACRTFNVLMSEGRNALVALLLND